MALQDIVEQTVRGLGYDLVEVNRSAGGLLRISAGNYGGKLGPFLFHLQDIMA